jgi:hypothetical protein
MSAPIQNPAEQLQQAALALDTPSRRCLIILWRT